MIGKAKHKSCHSCFVAAIQSPNLQAQDSDKVGNMAKLVPGCMWAFLLGSTAGHKGNYYKVFNKDNQLQWWTNQSLLNLIQSSTIILYNARYQLALGAHIPKWSTIKKQETHNVLEKKGI